MIVAGWIGCWRLARMSRDHPEVSWAADLARMGQVSILAYVVTGTFLPISSWDVFFTVLVTIGAANPIVARQLAGQATPLGYPAWQRRMRPMRPMRPVTGDLGASP
jgi:putative inorganic carbon (hco3(-)) transporter